MLSEGMFYGPGSVGITVFNSVTVCCRISQCVQCLNKHVFCESALRYLSEFALCFLVFPAHCCPVFLNPGLDVTSSREPSLNPQMGLNPLL